MPEELLVHIFARLSVKDILRVRSLNKSWRSTITSPQFQQAFADASAVRVALMVQNQFWEDGTMFLTQENKEECYRNHCARCPEEVVRSTNVTATAGGLVCVIERETSNSRSWDSSDPIVGVKVFVMNLVTGLRCELPSPRIMTSLPRLVRMEINVVEGSYTIKFIYTNDFHSEELEVSSLQVYDSLKNMWSKDDVGAMAYFKDVEVFNMYSVWGISYYYDNVATFYKETRAINVFNLDTVQVDPGNFRPDPNGPVHNVSGELYKLCTHEEQHGV